MSWRANSALAAGCDAVLHCNGNTAETRAVLEAAPLVTAEARRRLTAAAAWAAKRRSAQLDVSADRKALAGLIGD